MALLLVHPTTIDDPQTAFISWVETQVNQKKCPIIFPQKVFSGLNNPSNQE